jgi:hypothetical protein
MAAKSDRETRDVIATKCVKAEEEYKRWWARLKRAFNRVDKARQRWIRYQRELDLHDLGLSRGKKKEG